MGLKLKQQLSMDETETVSLYCARNKPGINQREKQKRNWCLNRYGASCYSGYDRNFKQINNKHKNLKKGVHGPKEGAQAKL